MPIWFIAGHWRHESCRPLAALNGRPLAALSRWSLAATALCFQPWLAMGARPPWRTPWWAIGVTYESPNCRLCDDPKSDFPVGVVDRCPVCRCSWRTNTKRALSRWAYCTHGLMVLDRARQPPPPCDDKKEKSEIEENKLASAGGWLVDRLAEWIGRGCGRLVEWTGRACSLATRCNRQTRS